MKINYIFLLKENLDRMINQGKEHYNILNKISNNVNKDNFKFSFDQRVYTVRYNTSYNENNLNMFNLSIMLSKDDGNNAKALCKINDLINKGEIRKDYNIIISYDGVSDYYCNQAYNLLNKFERKIRELVYLILTNTFGIRWYEETISDELEDKIKNTSNGKNKSKLMESALQEMTLYDLEMYLFEPYPDYKFDSMLEEGMLEESRLQEMTKDEIIETLSLFRPKSLWERFFKDVVEIDDIRESMSIIRKYRNKVAHSKSFNNNEYSECRNILNKIIKKMDFAIEKLTKLEFDIEEGYRAYSAFSDLSKQLIEIRNLSSQIASIGKPFGDIGKLNSNISNISNPFKDIEKLNSQTANMSNPFKNIGKLNSQTANMSNPFKDIGKLNSQAANISNPFKDIGKLNSQTANMSNPFKDTEKLNSQISNMDKPFGNIIEPYKSSSEDNEE